MFVVGFDYLGFLLVWGVVGMVVWVCLLLVCLVYVVIWCGVVCLVVGGWVVYC